jgi:hypothetical protein
MSCNKKGEFSPLMYIILALLIGIAFFFFITSISEAGERGANIAACKNWAIIQSSLKVPIIDIQLKSLDSPCVTFKDELKGDKFEIYETISRGMYDVWNMYGQGKVNFYKDWDWGKKNTACFIGDEITAKENLELDIDDFEEYISNNYPPQKSFTYTEFFTGTKNTKLDFGSGKIELNKNDKLYVIFTVKKMRELYTGSDEAEAIVLGCGIGGTIVSLGLGSVIPVAGHIAGAKVGCILGMIVSHGYKVIAIAGHADTLYPGLILISKEDLPSIEKSCDGGVYYRPK